MPHWTDLWGVNKIGDNNGNPVKCRNTTSAEFSGQISVNTPILEAKAMNDNDIVEVSFRGRGNFETASMADCPL